MSPYWNLSESDLTSTKQNRTDRGDMQGPGGLGLGVGELLKMGSGGGQMGGGKKSEFWTGVPEKKIRKKRGRA